MLFRSWLIVGRLVGRGADSRWNCAGYVDGLAHWRGGVSLYVRTVRTAFRAVQIAHSSSCWGSRNIEHIGSAHDDAEPTALKEVAG